MPWRTILSSDFTSTRLRKHPREDIESVSSTQLQLSSVQLPLSNLDSPELA